MSTQQLVQIVSREVLLFTWVALGLSVVLELYKPGFVTNHISLWWLLGVVGVSMVSTVSGRN